MNAQEVPEPILNSPFKEPAEYWRISEHELPERRQGRRPAMYFYRSPEREASESREGAGTAIELKLVNRIRAKLAEWRPQALRGEGGVTRTTMELMRHWRREERRHRLFFAQLEAAETIIFLAEARADFLQGIDIPFDEPGEEAKSAGMRAFRRHACKMATGTGKTTVMGMLAAWSILNKVADRNDARYSDVVLVVCPNVTIRNRLEELKPQGGGASLYRTRDLVPSHLMPQLARGHVLVTNWHVFEPRTIQVAGQSARVLRGGREIRTRETIRIGPKTTTARGKRYLTLADLKLQTATGIVTVLDEQKDRQGNLKSVSVESVRYVESDAKLIERILGREIGGKGNILVMNDEAHHAYRLRRPEPDEGEEDLFGEDDDDEAFYSEATVWVDGLDRIHKHRGINRCIDLSATPYYLGRVGKDANRPFPWVVSDFGLVDAIESGLVKIPQFAVRGHQRQLGSRLLQHMALDTAEADPGRTRRPACQGEAGGGTQVRARAFGHARRAVGGATRGMGAAGGRKPPAGVHHRVQGHCACQGHPSVARRGQCTSGDSAGAPRRIAQREREPQHHPRRLQGCARVR